MNTLSSDDRHFIEQFSNLTFPLSDFGHREHIQLAYGYLCKMTPEAAYLKVRQKLHAFLVHNQVPEGKYHETLTFAWVKAVAHFMNMDGPFSCFEAFIQTHPGLLDAKIMLTHFSKDTLFSDEARANILMPDLDPIPNYA